MLVFYKWMIHCLFFIQQEDPFDVTTVKEESAEEITVDRCYVCFDR
jgi:hypothetical protein